MKRKITNAEMAKAWDLAGDYLDFVAERTPCDRPDDEVRAIKEHIHDVIQPFLHNKAKIVSRNAKIGPRPNKRRR